MRLASPIAFIINFRSEGDASRLLHWNIKLFIQDLVNKENLSRKSMKENQEEFSRGLKNISCKEIAHLIAVKSNLASKRVLEIISKDSIIVNSQYEPAILSTSNEPCEQNLETMALSSHNGGGGVRSACVDRTLSSP